MNKGKKKKVYNRLIRKLLFQLAVLLAASAVAVSALRELLRGHVADGLVDVISRMLGISDKTAYALLRDNKIEHFKVGRTYKIPKIHILSYLKVIQRA